MKKSIFWLRAIACMLITNCHMKLLYPGGFQALGFGGYFGDCLFFIISGYCLFDCAEEGFGQYSKKRLLRIYVPYLLFLPFSIVVRGLSDGVLQLFFPILHYHFLPTILTIYPLFYLCAFLHKKKGVPFYACSAVVLASQLVYYFGIYDFSYPVTGDYCLLPMMSYFQMMLLGAQLRNGKRNGHFRRYLVLSALAFVAYVALSLRPLQGYASILQLYIGNTFALSLTIAFLNLEDRICLPWGVELLGRMTLEMYLVQVIIITAYQNTAFPCGFLMAWISIFAVAYCLHRASQKVRQGVDKSLMLFSKKYSKSAKTFIRQ